MRTQHVSQRELAVLLDVSQGHLSKVLSGRIERDSRVFATLASWVEAPGPTLEAGLLSAARRVAGGERRGLELLMHMMHIIAELQTERAAKEKRARRKRNRDG